MSFNFPLSQTQVTKFRLTRFLSLLCYSTNAEKVEGIRPEAVRANEEAARNLMKTCEALLSEDAPWLFGSSRPTVLDAHLIIVLGRLQDVGRTAVVPDRLQRYADMAFATPELQSVMQGRRTMVPKSGST